MDLPGFLNGDFARSKGYKDRLTPGVYTIACMFGLMAKQGFLSDAVFVAATDIVFKSPVFPGDRLSAEVNILDKKEGKRGGGPITYRWSVKNQEGKLIAEGVNT